MPDFPVIGATAAGDPMQVDVDRLVGSHACIVANSGGGKSGLVRRLLETTYGRVQHIVLDGEDEFYTLRERFPYVIAGGEGGDAPATVANAEQLAIGALTHGFSLIAQLNDLGADGAPEFIGRFLKALVHAPRALWHPVLVVVDEAQRFFPRVGGTAATEGVLELISRGRKRGFTLVAAGTKLSEIDPRVRGGCNNWLLGRVGQALDRRTMADQLGFTGAEARALRSIEDRHFYAFGPAFSREPVLFRVADVETTPVRAGQAKVPTPPAPEALREILQGLAPPPLEEAPPHPADRIPADPVEAFQAGGAVGAALKERDNRIAALEEYGALRDAQATKAEIGLRAARRGARLIQGEVALAIARLQDVVGRAAKLAIGEEETQVHSAGEGQGAVTRARPPLPLGPAEGEAQGADDDAPPAAGNRRNGASPRTPGSDDAEPHPLAVRLGDRMAEIAPAKLTWRQLASMCGYKPDGGYFRAGKRDALQRGLLVEEGDGVRAPGADGRPLSRDQAVDLWSRILPQPAPKIIAELVAEGLMYKGRLAAALGYSPDGGYFRSGLALLRQNGVTIERGDDVELADPLPGEARS